jgi:hypothetical protein
MKLNHIGIIALIATSGFLLGSAGTASGQAPYGSTTDFANYAMKLRESALLKMEPQVLIPTNSHILGGKYPWKTQIVTTIFWVGEPAGGNNPVHNFSSSWDLHWEQSYGGYDNPNPSSRRDYIPVNFIPRQNPFYVALPYNDVTRGTTKPEAASVIPWFKEVFTEPGKSVCRDRWVAIRNNATGKICFAQWSDCGPFRTDHYQYVFGTERPKPNLNQGAGLDVSPAVRDYLGLANTDVTDWKFVDFREVQHGPWANYGDNNSFVLLSRHGQDRANNIPAPSRGAGPPSGPTVIVK